MNNNIKLVKKIKINGIIECLSGLKIGGSISNLSIGGIDTIIIRNPKDNKPYIPGSSLKGKLRYLTEIYNGTVKEDKKNKSIQYGPTDDPTTIAAQLFGSSGTDLKLPSSVIVRDAHILNPESDFPNAPIPYGEIKTEVVIDRVIAKAMPRTIERVPAGAKFQMEIIINIFNFIFKKEYTPNTPDNNKESTEKYIPTLLTDDQIRQHENKLLYHLLFSLNLLQDDYLGGNGSRGYGQITFRELQIFDNQQPYTTNDPKIKQLLERFN